jgi:hypothetical protein
MTDAQIRFINLRQLLLDMGFPKVDFSEPHVGFQHDDSDTLIVLPAYRPNQIVAAHHLAMIRTMLDGKGLMDGREFDRLVAARSAEQSAS